MKADWGSADTGGWCGGEERRAPRGAGEWGLSAPSGEYGRSPRCPRHRVSGLLLDEPLTSGRQESLPHRGGRGSWGVGGSGQRVRTVCLPPRAVRGAL